MGYASKQGRTRVSSRSPSASGQCDRCGFLYNHNRLRWQMDWAGASLINKRILVCDTCYDKPQQQLRSIVVPADPVPIMNPRVPDYINAETDYRGTSGQNSIDPITGIPVIASNTRVTSVSSGSTGGELLLENLSGAIALEDGTSVLLLEGSSVVYSEGQYRVTQQTGEAPGGINMLPGTILNAPGYGNPTLPYGASGIPETGYLPGANYVLWNNNSPSALTWTNNNLAVILWVSP